MLKRSVAVLLFLLFASYVNSQQVNSENNRIIPPSPTAASLGKYGEVPLSLYTGTPNISVPIYTIEGGKLSLPISLSYHVGSVRPNDIPGWVGLGWSLNAGGVVTRTVRDIPDDFGGGQLGTGKGYYYDLIATNPSFNTIFNSIQSPQLSPEAIAFFWENENRAADTKPDEYNFNFAGHAGSFYFGHDGQLHLKSQSPLRITFEIDYNYDGSPLYSSMGHFKKWIITDEQGNQYQFEKKEWSYGLMGTNGGEHVAYVSSWYLTSITSAVYGTITFGYTQANNKVRTKAARSEMQVFVLSSSGAVENTVLSYNRDGVSQSFDEVIYLSRIDFENGYMIFETTKRNDPTYNPPGYGYVFEEQKLSKIELYSTTKKLYSWNFTYEEANRLKLTSITKFSPNNKEGEKYVFEYDPRPFSGSTGLAYYDNPYDINATDHWGYYNGNRSNSRIPITVNPNNANNFIGEADKSTSFTDVTASTLSKIIYPTGGYTKFTFEAHDYSTLVEPYTPDVVSNDPVPGTQYRTYADFYLPGPASGEYTCSTDPSTITFTLPKGTEILKRVYSKYVQDDLYASCSQESNIITYSEVVYLTAGTYNLNQLFNNQISSDCSGLDPNGVSCGDCAMRCWLYNRYLVAVPNDYMINPSSLNKLAGGVRIQAIETFDGLKSQTKSYSYKLTDQPSVSSGVLNKFPEYCIKDLQPYGYAGGYVIHSDPVKALPTGNHIGYATVTEQLGDGSRTVYSFSTYADHPDDIPFDLSGSGFGPYISNDIKRGLPQSIRYENAAGQTLKELVYEYDFTQKQFYGNLLDNKLVVPSVDESGTGLLYVVSKSKLSSLWLQKKKEIERIYSQSDPAVYLEKSKEFFYREDNYQVGRTEELNSKSERQITVFKYANDFAGVYGQMVVENRVAEPIQQKVYKNNLDNEVRGIKNNYFLPYNSGFVVNESRESSLLGKESFVDVTFNSYDLYGNVLQLTKKDGVPVSYLWAYHHAYPIAEVQNAPIGQVAYTSFETEEAGNWQGINALSYASDDPILSGLSYYKGTFNIFKDALNSSGSYIVSYWSKNGSYWVNGSSPKKERLLGIWTYYEHLIINPSGGKITISGSGAIDELRLYPSGALMTTYTYAPLIGVTSTTDPNGNPSYFEYDDFGRLMHIRDKDQNILKKFCYNYFNQVEECQLNTAPLWQPTGRTQTLTYPCAANSAYAVSQPQAEYRDVNTYSSTYSQTEWRHEGTASSPADWQVVSTSCEQVSGRNTGNLVVVKRDVNPCSASYNQPQTTVTADAVACPPPPPCDAACTGPNKRCVRGYCETGEYGVVMSMQIYEDGNPICVMYLGYTFSDGYYFITETLRNYGYCE